MHFFRSVGIGSGERPDLDARPHPGASAAPVWVADGDEIRAGDRIRLTRPMTYLVTGTDRTEPAAIRAGLPIAADPYAPAARELPYWPRFDDLTPGQRRYYFDWMATGRAARPAEVGYAFLFFYGLERRALFDQADVPTIFDEVVRMRRAFDTPGDPYSHSFTRYTTEFLWHLLVRDQKAFTPKQFRAAIKLSRADRADTWLHAATAWVCGGGYVLPDWLAFELAGRLPKSKRSVVAKRVGDELERVFRTRYAERFGKGMPLRPSKRERRFEYRPASAALPPAVVTGCSAMDRPSQFDPLAELWNACVDDLRRLSTVAAHGGGEMTSERWHALPPELRATVDHPLTDRFADFIATRAGDSGDTLVVPRDLATLLGIEPAKRMTPAVARKMAETVEAVGYCLEPDARLSGRGYDDQPLVTLYLNMIPTPIEPARYRAVSALLEVCIAVASADVADVDEPELARLARRIDEAFEFNEAEHRRLDALRALRLACRAATADACRSVKRLDRPQRELVGRLMVAVVAGGGRLTAKQVRAVRKVYGAIGLDKPDVDRAVADLTPTNDLPTVMPAVSGSVGEQLPPPPDEQRGVVPLDRAAIAAKLAETREGARMLADAMNAEAEEVPPASPVGIEPPAADPADVPAPITGFYQQVIAKPAWTRDELATVARSHGLMLAGAIESLNDWSTDRHGGPLLYEDGDQITLESAYLS